jgi:hypothetical protein
VSSRPSIDVSSTSNPVLVPELSNIFFRLQGLDNHSTLMLQSSGYVDSSLICPMKETHMLCKGIHQMPRQDGLLLWDISTWSTWT